MATSTSKMGLEMLFHLQWRNKPDKVNVMGMYDSPATTSNFEAFKSYLLKNSGVPGDDLQVIFVADDNSEWSIDSDAIFKFVVSMFRLKARVGEVIVLKLDRISDKLGKKMFMKEDIDNLVEECDENGIEAVLECKDDKKPPKWFLKYMKQYKKSLVEETTAAVANLMSNGKSCSILLNPLHAKKSKLDIPRRPRHSHQNEFFVMDKESRRNMKYDRKLDVKLEKLDAKTKKLKEKKRSLLESTLVEQPLPQPSTSQSVDRNNVEYYKLFNAIPHGQQENVIHFSGGETYEHIWQIMNTGAVPWNDNTKIRMDWGSMDMVPTQTSISCPHLKPFETGAVSVSFKIPKTVGRYDSFWHFYQDGYRFGNYLNFAAIVGDYGCIGVDSVTHTKENDVEYVEESIDNEVETTNDDVKELELTLEQIKILQNDESYSSESDNQSVNSLFDSIASGELKDDFVMIKNETEQCSTPQNKYGISEDILITLPKTDDILNLDEENEQAFVVDIKKDVDGSYYIMWNGKKLKLLDMETNGQVKDLNLDENAVQGQTVNIQTPESITTNAEIHQTDNIKPNESLTAEMGSSICSQQSRLFVFPESKSGFEIISNSLHSMLENDTTDKIKPEAADSCENIYPTVPNYQQTLQDTRRIISEHEQILQSLSNSVNTSPVTIPMEQAIPLPPPTPSDSIHILPESIVAGAVNVASSAINTAKTVINMIAPPKEREQQPKDGTTLFPETKRSRNLRHLAEMGFYNIEYNNVLLDRYKDDLQTVIVNLVE